MPKLPESFLNVRQAARLLGVHENTIRNWADAGTLRVAATLPSGYRRFERRDVLRLADRLQKVDDWGDMYGYQDDCLIAITDGNPLPASRIAQLPPWRAVLVARVAAKAGIPIEGGTLDELVDEARRVGGQGVLNWPPQTLAAHG